MSGLFWHYANSGPVVTINFAICISPPHNMSLIVKVMYTATRKKTFFWQWGQ